MSTPPSPPATHDDPPPALHVRSIVLPSPVDLLDRIPARPSAAWLHDGRGLLGAGEAHVIETSGPDRFSGASARWSALVRAAVVDDEAAVPGSGLVAFGTFSYADGSVRPSRLVIPRAVLGVHEGTAFLTVVSDAPITSDPLEALAVFEGRAGGGTADGSVREADGAARTANGGPRAADGAPADGDAADRAAVGANATDEQADHFAIEPDHTPDEYQGLVARAVARIRDGEAEKTVLSETVTVADEGGDGFPIAAVIRSLARRYPTTWTYRVGDVVGASPEMLAQTTRQAVFSRVLAGTRPVGEGEELAEDERARFFADPKERAEHAFAVDSVTERLVRVADCVRAAEEPFVLRLPGLEHLATDVTAVARDGVTSLDVAAVLHPSAAVSGTPREAANAMIADLELHDRGGYAAPVGWMDAGGSGQWAIALRMAHVLSPGELRIQAGGGIVSASDPVTEHAEVLAKTRPMLNALRDAAAR